MPEQRALSQWEIDALLNELPGEGGAERDQPVAGPERSTPSAIKSYDFRRPDKFSKEQWATLQSIHEHFARMIAASFSSRLRTLVSVRLTTLEQGLYEEWQREVPNPTVCYVMALRPLSGSMVVEFSAELAAEVVDRLLGGNGALVDRTREMGEVEFGLLRSFSRTFGHALQEMWSNVRPVEPSLQDLGQDASLIQVAAPTDVVLAAVFEMTVGGHRGQVSLCMPYTVMEPLTPSLSAQLWMSGSQRHDATEAEQAAMASLIGRSRVDLSVRLGAVDVPARTVAGLQVGDTFVLEARLGRPLDVIIGERSRFTGLPGQVGSHMGVQIAEVLDEAAESLRPVRREPPTETLDLTSDPEPDTTADTESA